MSSCVVVVVALGFVVAGGLFSTRPVADAAAAVGCASRAYVTNGDDGTVSVIDTATNTVVGSAISVGDSPAGTTITPDGARVYVTDANGTTVSTFDTATATVTSVTVGRGPLGVAVAPCPQLVAALQTDGRTVVLSGSAFAPATTLTVTIASTPETLGTVTVGSTGTFRQSFIVPCTVPAGDRIITATAPSRQHASATVSLGSCAEPAVLVQPRFTG